MSSIGLWELLDTNSSLEKNMLCDAYNDKIDVQILPEYANDYAFSCLVQSPHTTLLVAAASLSAWQLQLLFTTEQDNLHLVVEYAFWAAS